MMGALPPALLIMFDCVEFELLHAGSTYAESTNRTGNKKQAPQRNAVRMEVVMRGIVDTLL
jgi:hypothetical protein